MSNTTTVNPTPQWKVSVIHKASDTHPNLKIRDAAGAIHILEPRQGTSDLSLFRALRPKQELLISLDQNQRYYVAAVEQPPAQPVAEVNSTISADYFDRLLATRVAGFQRVDAAYRAAGIELPPEVITAQVTTILLCAAKGDAVFIQADEPEVSE